MTVKARLNRPSRPLEFPAAVSPARTFQPTHAVMIPILIGSTVATEAPRYSHFRRASQAMPQTPPIESALTTPMRPNVVESDAEDTTMATHIAGCKRAKAPDDRMIAIDRTAKAARGYGPPMVP